MKKIDEINEYFSQLDEKSDEYKAGYMQAEKDLYSLTESTWEIIRLQKELEELKSTILKLISSKEAGYTVIDKMNDITMLCNYGIDDRFRRLREFLFKDKPSNYN